MAIDVYVLRPWINTSIKYQYSIDLCGRYNGHIQTNMIVGKIRPRLWISLTQRIGSSKYFMMKNIVINVTRQLNCCVR